MFVWYSPKHRGRCPPVLPAITESFYRKACTFPSDRCHPFGTNYRYHLRCSLLKTGCPRQSGDCDTQMLLLETNSSPNDPGVSKKSHHRYRPPSLSAHFHCNYKTLHHPYPGKRRKLPWQAPFLP